MLACTRCAITSSRSTGCSDGTVSRTSTSFRPTGRRSTVFVPAHNESRVIRDSLDALLSCDYPADRLRIVPIDDRSEDDTRAIMQEYADAYPDRIFPHLA